MISALLEREDFVPAMALLVHWLSNADRVGLAAGRQFAASTFRTLAAAASRGSTDNGDGFGEPSIDQAPERDTREVWPLVRKFFDYFEANAEEFWSAPQFMLGRKQKSKHRDWDRELTAADEEARTTSEDEGCSTPLTKG